MVFQGRFGGVLGDPGIGVAGQGHEGGPHAGGDANLSLTAYLGAGNAGVLLGDETDGSCGQEGPAHLFQGDLPVAPEQTDQGGDNAGGTAGGRGDHPVAGGILFGGGEGIGAEINEQPLGILGHPPGALEKERGLAMKADRSRQIALGRQTPPDRGFHGGDDPVQAGVDFLFLPAGDGPLVGHHDFGKIQPVLFKELCQLGGVFIGIPRHSPQ